MSITSDKRIWGLLAGLGVVLGLGSGVALLGVLELLATLSGGTTLLALVQAIVPYLVVLVVLGIAGVVALVALVAILVKAASDELDSDSLQSLADRATDSSLARKLGLANRL